MISDDPLACRRALREIREIAAVARLDGAQMSEQEALKTIGAIAEWAADEGSTSPADCGDLIERLDALVGSADLDALDDHATLAMFRAMTSLVQGEGAAGGGGSAD